MVRTEASYLFVDKTKLLGLGIQIAMKQIKISKVFKNAKHVITANSPVLLVGTAIAGVVATGVLAAKGGYEARAIVDDFEDNEGREATVPEKVQLTWLCFAPPVLTGASTIAATVGVHAIHARRFTAITGLYAVASSQLDSYQEKAEELLGAKKSQQISDFVAQKQIENTGPVKSHDIIVTGDGDQLCHDEFGERYVQTTYSKLQAAVLKVKEQMLEDDYCSLNDFYEHAGMRPSVAGSLVGWSGTNPDVMVANGELTPDGRPCISFRFQPQPAPNYRHTR